MSSPIRTFFEIIWLYFKGFHPVEFVRDGDRISLHPSGWRVNGSGRMKRAKDAVDFLETAEPEQWRQIYCGMTPFLVSDKGNVKHVDGSAVKMSLANGRYQIMYKPEDARGRGRDGRIHKKRVYRSMLVAMAWLDFRKGDTEHEIHHINGYRTDDRVANLMVVDHKEHMRIHNLGPCGLSGLPDEKIVEAPASVAPENDKAPEPDTKKSGKHVKGLSTDAAHVCSRKENETDAGEDRSADATQEQASASGGEHAAQGEPKPKRKRRRGKRGGKKHRDAESPETRENDAADSYRESDRAIIAAVTPISAASNEKAGAPSEETAGTMEQSAPPREASNDKPKRTRRSRNAKPDVADIDWVMQRMQLDAAIKDFLDEAQSVDGGNTMSNQQLNKAAKPVYRALKPFFTCPDAVTAFDASLSRIRAILASYDEANLAIPAPVHSMLGTMHQVVKDAVRKIAAEGDEVEVSCLREMLLEEAEEPLFEKTPHARKFRQCVSIIDSRNEKESKSA